MPRLSLFRWVALALTIIFVGRVAVSLLSRVHDMPGWEAYWIAQQIAAGKGFSLPYDLPWPRNPIGTSGVHPTAWMDPFYTFVLAGFIRLFGNGHQLAAAIFNIALLVLVFGLTYRLAERLLGPVAGVGALVVLGLDSRFSQSAGQMNNTMLAAVFLLLSASAFVAFLSEPGRPRAVVLGLTLGLTVLACPGAQLFAPIAAAMVLWLGRDRLRRSLANAAVVLGFAALVVLPWTIRNYSALGEFVPVRTGLGNMGFWSVIAVGGAVEPDTLPAHLTPPWRAETALMAVQETVNSTEKREALDQGLMNDYARALGPSDYSARNEAQRDSWFAARVKQFLIAHPGLSLRLAWAKFQVFFLGTGKVGALVFVLALAGAVMNVRVPALTAVALFAASFVAPFLVLVCCYSRYRAPIDPLLVVLAMGALWRIERWIRERWRSPNVVGAEPSG